MTSRSDAPNVHVIGVEGGSDELDVPMEARTLSRRSTSPPQPTWASLAVVVVVAIIAGVARHHPVP